ncbi:MAG: hypothetical protein K6F86_03825 [Lachnospiraceae bacterium]|nr:hypothetical protein [Lachnospiraceae bacterium]
MKGNYYEDNRGTVNASEELKKAAKIQASFLPREFPPFSDRDEFELFSSMVPEKMSEGIFMIIS